MNRQLITVLYSQISVFSNRTPEFNAWEDAHVDQGMSWRDGHVSFGVPDHDGPCLLEWGSYVAGAIDTDLAERVLTAPLIIDSAGAGLATVVDEIAPEIASGGYQIWYAATRLNRTELDEPDLHLQILFEPTNDASFNIIKPGVEITATEVRLRRADIAG